MASKVYVAIVEDYPYRENETHVLGVYSEPSKASDEIFRLIGNKEYEEEDVSPGIVQCVSLKSENTLFSVLEFELDRESIWDKC